MNIETMVDQIIHDAQHFDEYVRQLESCLEAEVQGEVERHKQIADENWYEDPNVSLFHANIIIGIGWIRHSPGIKALGMMARGDAIKLLGRADEAWMTLEHAGELYLSVGDEVGWARTWIGRLYVAADIGCVDYAMQESRRAREILVAHNQIARCLSLDLNAAYAYLSTGRYQETLDVCWPALKLAEQVGERGLGYLGSLYTNIGCAYTELGHLQDALVFHQRAHDVFKAEDTLGLATTTLNITNVALMQGRYRYALEMLHKVDKLATLEQYPKEYLATQRFLVESYLALNRYGEARDLAQNTIAKAREPGLKQELGYTLRHLAIAQAELKHFEEALAALDEAEAVLTFVEATSWVADVRLKRGQVLLRKGDFEGARAEAQTAILNKHGQVSTAYAHLLDGQAAFAMQDYPAAAEAAKKVLRIAQKQNIPWLRYSSHLLLGRIAVQQQQLTRAIRRYNAAAHTVERVQRNLSITLRPGFLENKEDALKSLIGLYLDRGRTAQAFQALERSKSQTFFNHMSNRDNLRWLRHDPHSQRLIEDLERLRAEHQNHYWMAHQSDFKAEKTVTEAQQAQSREALARCERQMREITEQLYLHSSHENANLAGVPSWETIQAQLPEGSLLVEFYVDGGRIWVFTLTQQTIQVHPLPITFRSFEKALRTFQFDMACALKIGMYKGAQAAETSQLTGIMQARLKQFYQDLLKPIEPQITAAEQIIIVPYGVLHYLPFHLLRMDERYLIEDHEVYVLPAAGMVTAHTPKREPAALILADTWDNHLPHTLKEAQTVHAVLGGDLFCDKQVDRSVLQNQPGKILHIAAHGEYRVDQPDLSYIYLGGSQIFADDLFQQDLSYELVTLSACETGRAKPVPGDELIGLGRGFLYAGAGSLVASLWRVEDSLTITLMERFYRALREGDSKAAALRTAQLSLLRETPELHPAFWGAFQLSGNPDPIF